uniref:DEK-C domain-containing protein n=1 Tax=Mandrillus leucophaeus TaxID=9568 RepID=A0A2K6A0S1_MANLE
MHPKPSGKPLPKSKKTSSKGSKKERNSSGMARKAKRTKHPEILSDVSGSDEDEKKNKSHQKKTAKRGKPKQKATSKSKKSVKSANVKKADGSTTKKNQNSSKKESESEDSSDDEPLIKNANLEEVTMKQICKKVYENYPTYDLTERKDFIKTANVKELIS